MAELFLSIVVFTIATLILVKSADMFTDAAEFFGVRFGISPFIIGITFVAFGTSLPELVSSVVAVLSGVSDVGIGNVIGANITNIFLVLGISAVIAAKIKITYEIERVDLPLVLASAAYLIIVIMDGHVSFFESLIGLIGGVIFVGYSITSARHHVDRVLETEAKRELIHLKNAHHLYYYGTAFVISAVLIFFSSQYVIGSLSDIAMIFSVPEGLLAIGLLALGTTLPELMVSIQAVRHGDPEIAVGNVLGSTIINSFVVISVPRLFGPVTISPAMIGIGVPFLIIATLLFFFMTQDREITNWEGYVLLLFYLLFVGSLFGIIV